MELLQIGSALAFYTKLCLMTKLQAEQAPHCFHNANGTVEFAHLKPIFDVLALLERFLQSFWHRCVQFHDEKAVFGIQSELNGQRCADLIVDQK